MQENYDALLEKQRRQAVASAEAAAAGRKKNADDIIYEDEKALQQREMEEQLRAQLEQHRAQFTAENDALREAVVRLERGLECGGGAAMRFTRLIASVSRKRRAALDGGCGYGDGERCSGANGQARGDRDAECRGTGGHGPGKSG